MILIQLRNPDAEPPKQYTVAGSTLDEAITELHWRVLSRTTTPWPISTDNCSLSVAIESAEKNRFIRVTGDALESAVRKINAHATKMPKSI